jgi:putative restriction endonuclease
MELELPLAYFVGVAPGHYKPAYPVYIIGEEPDSLAFVLGFTREEIGTDLGALTSIERTYALRTTRQRLHQPRFREEVMRAYRSSCAICSLRHAQLLDAAHIIEDSHSDGDPVVQNGIALCKIHHAAYDQLFLGIAPDCIVQVSRRLLDEQDGPMLKHGLQEMHGRSLQLPRSRRAHPDRDRLESKYQRFRDAA